MRPLLPTTLLAFTLLAGCASTAPRPDHPAQALAMQQRISWGVNAGSARQLQQQGWDRYLQAQLHPGQAVLPAAIQAQIDAMTISQTPMDQLVIGIEQRRKEANAVADDTAKQQAQKDYQQELNRLAREAATRSVLLDVYSPNQLQQQLSWFWLNHFSVHQGKHNLRAMVGDYEMNAIAPHALGKFRDLLGATVHHPAMLRYLDNEANAANRINENYARELMELHTLGVNGGYSQKDVQELARILTGVGVNLGTETPKVKPALQAQYVRRGLFEFNPNRHDYGDKQFLGQAVTGRGLAELDEALDRLSRSPATARFISGKLAQYFVGDTPPETLVASMAQTFRKTDGDIRPRRIVKIAAGWHQQVVGVIAATQEHEQQPGVGGGRRQQAAGGTEQGSGGQRFQQVTTVHGVSPVSGASFLAKTVKTCSIPAACRPAAKPVLWPGSGSARCSGNTRRWPVAEKPVFPTVAARPS